MQFKTNYPSIVISGCFVLMLFVSCQSHEQKLDDAFNQVKEEKMISKESFLIDKETTGRSGKIEQIKKNESQDEWSKFKLETEKKIIANEHKIKEIKDNPNASSKLLRKLSNLQKSNNDLRRQIDDYNEEVKLKWEKFKTAINHDVNEIEIELKDIAINNKK